MGRKINEIVAQVIINRYVSGDDCSTLGQEYKINTKTVEKIIRGETWQKCTRPENIKENKYNAAYPELNELQTNIIIGSLLGDGCISNHTNARFIKFQCEERKEYLDYHAMVMGSYTSKITERISDKKWDGGFKTVNEIEPKLVGYEFYTHCHPRFTKLRNKWYPNNKKQIPTDLDINPQIISIWFCDDGSNEYQLRKAVFCTQGFSFEEATFLSEKLKHFDVMAKVESKKSNYSGVEQPILGITGKDYDNLISLVKPFIPWECFKHKIAYRSARTYIKSGKYKERYKGKL